MKMFFKQQSTAWYQLMGKRHDRSICGMKSMLNYTVIRHMDNSTVLSENWGLILVQWWFVHYFKTILQYSFFIWYAEYSTLWDSTYYLTVIIAHMTDISVLLHIYRLFKGSVSRDLRPPFFSWFDPIWAPDKQAKVFSNSLSISPRYSITKWDKKILINQYFILQIFSFMTDVFTPERISPDCLFKINHR